MKAQKEVLIFVFGLIILIACVGCGKENVQEKKDLVQKEIVWDFNNKVSEKISVGTGHAYLSNDKKYAWLYEIELDTRKDFSTIEIPAKIQEAEVKCIGAYYGDVANEDEYGKNLFGFIFNDAGDTFEHTKEAKRQNKIKNIVIPDGVQTIKQDSFYSVNQIECIEMPKELKRLEKNIFSNVPKKMIFEGNEYFTLEKGIFLERKNMCIRMILGGIEKIVIPADVKKIEKYSLPIDIKVEIEKANPIYSVDGTCVYKKKSGELVSFFVQKDEVKIPSSVTKIESNMLCSDKALKILVEEENPNYVSKGTCVYEKKTGNLVSVTVKDDTLTIAEGVKNIEYGFDILGKIKDVKQVILPKSLKRLKSGVFSFYSHEPELIYKGNRPWIF